MPRAKSVQSSRAEPRDLEAKIIEAIQKVGPKNISLLSRLTGAHAETIRYKVKKQFTRKGFRLHADVDYAKLGLSRHTAQLRFSRRYEAAAPEILKLLNEKAYLVYSSKIVPQGYYAANFALPEVGSEPRELLEFMVERGILDSYEFERTVANRINSMNPRYFDFKASRWDVDWSRIKGEAGTPLAPSRPPAPAKVDEYDLLLIKELQMDALQHTVGIARKLKVHQKTLEYHYRVHVQKQKLVRGFAVRWMRDVEKSLAHSVMLTRLVFRGLKEEDAKVQLAVSKIPFLWSEELSAEGTYLAMLCVPVQEAVTTFAYLNEQVPGINDKVAVEYIKKQEAHVYTIPYNMFSDGWTYDADAVKAKLTVLKKA